MSLVFVSATLAIIFGRQAFHLAEEAEPKIALRFGGTDAYRKAVIHKAEKFQWDGMSIRVRAESGQATVPDCTAWVTKFERESVSGQFEQIPPYESVRLP